MTGTLDDQWPLWVFKARDFRAVNMLSGVSVISSFNLEQKKGEKSVGFGILKTQLKVLKYKQKSNHWTGVTGGAKARRWFASEGKPAVLVALS